MDYASLIEDYSDIDIDGEDELSIGSYKINEGNKNRADSTAGKYLNLMFY